ncbi:MAG: hypothetical protein WA993_03320 [Candidatus Binatus sp.]|jgi:hypothetical protein
MIKDASNVITGFQSALAQADLGQLHSTIQHEAQPAPHRPHSLRRGKCAVYVFSLSQSWGSHCPAGPDRVIKVGKAGPNSNARFQSQHYNPNSAGSTVAGSLTRCTILWPYLGITGVVPKDVGEWIRQHVDRDNFYFDAVDKQFLRQLETYLCGTFGSVFEGSESRDTSSKRPGLDEGEV